MPQSLMNHETIAQAWTQFSALVVAPDAPDVQRKEMKRAFYSGCQAMLHLCINMPEHISDDEAEKRLIGFHEELHNFNEDIIAGRA